MLGISAMNPFEKTFAVFLLLFMFSMILSIAVLQIAAGILMMTWLSRIAFDKDYHYRKTPLDLPVVVLAGIRTISVFTSIHPEVSLSYLWKELPFYAMFFVFAQNIDVTNKRFMKVLFWAIIASALIGTVYGIHLHIITDFQERAKSITSGYMTFSMFLCALIVIVIPLINHLSKRPWIV